MKTMEIISVGNIVPSVMTRTAYDKLLHRGVLRRCMPGFIEVESIPAKYRLRLQSPVSSQP
jgi:hypothetical protein